MEAFVRASGKEWEELATSSAVVTTGGMGTEDSLGEGWSAEDGEMVGCVNGDW